MANYTVDEAANAQSLLISRLFGVLLEAGVLTREQIATAFNRALEDSSRRGDPESVRELLREMAGQPSSSNP